MTEKWVIVPWEKWQEHQKIVSDKTMTPTVSEARLTTTKHPEIITDKTSKYKPNKLEQPREYKWLSWK